MKRFYLLDRSWCFALSPRPHQASPRNQRNFILNAPQRYIEQPNALVIAAHRITPNWFAATMGTGATSLVLAQLPLQSAVLHMTAVALWVANIILFTLIASLHAAQWIMFPDEARRKFDNPAMPMFLGTVPMGLATIVNGFILYGVPLWGDVAIHIAQALWWIDVAMALACGVAVPFWMFTRQQHGLDTLSAIWLLPVVACEVAAVSAGLLAPKLDAAAVSVLMLGYVLWSISVPVAMGILVLLFLRLALHKLPSRDIGVSAWLALGPIGTGALGLLVLGADAPDVLGGAGLHDAATVAHGLGVVGGLMLWGYGTWWFALAILKTIYYVRTGLPFNLGWWGFTFPLGVYTLSTFALARATGLEAFAICGTALALLLVGLWAIVATRSIHWVWLGWIKAGSSRRLHALLSR